MRVGEGVDGPGDGEGEDDGDLCGITKGENIVCTAAAIEYTPSKLTFSEAVNNGGSESGDACRASNQMRMLYRKMPWMASFPKNVNSMAEGLSGGPWMR